MLKQHRQHLRILAKGDHTVANIARRQHLQLLAEPSRTAPVIGHRDYRREVLYPDRLGLARVDKPLEPRQQTRKAIAAADGNKLQPL